MAIGKKMTPIAPIATCAMQGALCKAEHALCWLRLRASVVRIGTERELPVRPCTCHAAHSGRQTIARRCHGGAWQAEVLRASGSTAHKLAPRVCEGQ